MAMVAVWSGVPREGHVTAHGTGQGTTADATTRVPVAAGAAEAVARSAHTQQRVLVRAHRVRVLLAETVARCVLEE